MAYECLPATSRKGACRHALWLALPCDLAVIAYALWTLGCHTVVLLGGRPAELYWTAAGLAIFAVAALCGCFWRFGVQQGLSLLADTADPEPPGAAHGLKSTGALRLRALAAAGGFSLLALWLHSRDLGQVLLPAGGLMLLLSLAQGALGAPAARATFHPAWALLACVFSAGFTAAMSRPDGDEALYLAMATSLARFPDLPVLGFDPLHGMPEWHLQTPVYRVHTWELLAGVLGHASGLWPIRFTHVLFPAIAGFLVPLALLRLAREVAPRHALWVALAALAVLLCDGSTHRTFGNFGLVRLFQGKAVFVTLMVPLLSAYGLRFGQEPTVKRFVLLIAGQIAAVGLTSTALPFAPLVSVVGVVSGMPLRRVLQATRTLGLGLCSALYPVAIGLSLYREMVGERAIQQASSALQTAVAAPIGNAPAGDATAVVAEAFARVLGQGPMAALYLAALLLTPALASVRGARLAANLGALFFGVLANPWLQGLLTTYLLRGSVYWRIFWVLPLPVLVALTCGTPLLNMLAAAPTALRYTVPTGALGFMLLCFPQQATWSKTNGVRPTRFALKVGPEFEVARAAAALLPPQGGFVATDRAPSIWLPAMPERAFPVIVEEGYLRRRHRGLRVQLQHCLGRRRARRMCGEAFVLQALRDLHVSVVALERHNPHYAAFARTMSRLGLTPRARVGRYRLWAAPATSARADVSGKGPETLRNSRTRTPPCSPRHSHSPETASVVGKTSAKTQDPWSNRERSRKAT